MEPIKWTTNRMRKAEDKKLQLMSPEKVASARAFHQSFPQYSKTPLVKLNNMANLLGVEGIYIKDESYRFGLNAFKVLGGSFAIGQHIARQLGRDIGQVSYNYLSSPQFRKEFGQATFYTATDGNHGRGVAWAAKKLGQKAVVRMPRGSSRHRFENIAKEGATVTIEDANYDQCVRIAAAEAAQAPRGVMIQDTAWEGYVEVPTWIMQGYGTMALEVVEQLKEAGIDRPTHIIVQAGVGSLAGAVQGFFANLYPDNCPTTVIVEAAAADCLYQSALGANGNISTVGGDLETIMAGLACGEPNTISWDILKNYSTAFVSCPDWVAAKGMRMLGSPCRGDLPIISGESGAVGMGLVATVLQDSYYKELREAMGLSKKSRILLFSTEGDTDPVRYQRIVWGDYPYFARLG